MDSNSPQSQKDQLETVTRKRVSIADGEESIKAIAEAQEKVQADLRLYEKEPGNPEGKKLGTKKGDRVANDAVWLDLVCRSFAFIYGQR